MEKLKELACRECGSIFQQPKGNGRLKVCSDKCRKQRKLKYEKSHRKQPDEIWKFEKECVCCKGKFTPNVFNQILCKKECVIIYNSFEYKCKNGGVSGWERIRFEVFKRDNFTCQYCGRNVKEDGVKLQCDHKVPKSKGGEDILSNLETACEQCNQGKKAVLLENTIK